MNSSTSNPQVYSLTTTAQKIKSGYKYIPLLFIFVAAQILVYNYFAKMDSLKLKAWDMLAQESGYQVDSQNSSILYEYQGTITNLQTESITIESGNSRAEFFAPTAQYSTVAPYDRFELWPTKLIMANDRSQFKVGDSVVVIAKAVPNSEQPVISNIIKIINQE